AGRPLRGPQAGPPLLPHAPRARRHRLGSGRLNRSEGRRVARPPIDDLRLAPTDVLLPSPSGGGQPRQTERPQSIPWGTPDPPSCRRRNPQAPWTEISLGAHVGLAIARHGGPPVT